MYEGTSMKTLDEEIESRLREVLPDADGSTATGWIQLESCRNTLLRGNILVVLRRPGSFPKTHSITVDQNRLG